MVARLLAAMTTAACLSFVTACSDGGSRPDPIDAYEQASFVATYELTIQDPEAPDECERRTLTFYKLRDVAERVDEAACGPNSEDRTTIDTEDENIICHPGGEGIEGYCEQNRFDVPPLALEPLLITIEEDNILQSSDEFEETIAGEAGKCYQERTNYSGEDLENTVCMTSDGILLRLRVSSDITGLFEYEATSVSRNVPDDAFEPPFPTQDGGLLELTPISDEH
jgi:hypothetical protein